jgi:cbb3-type cytochrome oxidase maturation protein
MSVLFVALPVALVLAVLAVLGFIYTVRSGQLDDLETPPRRILFDDVAGSERKDE